MKLSEGGNNDVTLQKHDLQPECKHTSMFPLGFLGGFVAVALAHPVLLM